MKPFNPEDKADRKKACYQQDDKPRDRGVLYIGVSKEEGNKGDGEKGKEACVTVYEDGGHGFTTLP